MSVVGVIVLAAGASTRMGSPKQLLLMDNKTLLRRTVDTALGSDCGPVLVVLGANAELLLPELENLPVRYVVNWDWRQGIGSSIAAGITALLEQSDRDNVQLNGVFIMLCDQPHVTPTLLQEMMAVFHDTNAPMVASEYGETLGVPAFFARSLFPELAALKGDEGARKVIQRGRPHVARVSFPEGILDIDTPEDYQSLH